jgi:transcriptional regulator with GAF, ATPase, and Fis domain
MNDVEREAGLVDAFAALADTLVADYDVVELLQTLVDTCVALLDVTAAGLLLADVDSKRLDLMASTSEESRLVETMQLAAEAGPCIECFRTGAIVSMPDIRNGRPDWADFNEKALALGFLSVYAVPLRLRSATVGTLNLFRSAAGELNERDTRVAQALADVATIGILHERDFRASDLLRQQLQLALNSRVVIEQAKGVLAHTHDVSTNEAFALMRDYARSHRIPLAQVAQQLVQRTLIF